MASSSSSGQRRPPTISHWVSWTHSFVPDIVGIYYPDDSTVSKDWELQAWLTEILQEGFLDRVSSGEVSVSVSCPPDPTCTGQQSIGFQSFFSPLVPHLEILSALDSCAGLIKYLSMIIFNCSDQHAAINRARFMHPRAKEAVQACYKSGSHRNIELIQLGMGQLEFRAWMPYTPTTMWLLDPPHPPPNARQAWWPHPLWSMPSAMPLCSSRMSPLRTRTW